MSVLLEDKRSRSALNDVKRQKECVYGHRPTEINASIIKFNQDIFNLKQDANTAIITQVQS
jgi:hypothetical protein